MTRRRPLATAACLATLAATVAVAPARAQIGNLGQANAADKQPLTGDQPVTFTADQVTYDRDRAIVTASGHVEAWQNDHVLRADTITFDRNTNVAAAAGHVVLLEPDGEVLFAEYAELQQGMKDGVLRGMRAQLQQNGKLAANGARRANGIINELSKVVYSTCNVCADDPSRPPFWALRASSAVQDTEHQRIEYTNATLDMFGQPVAYFPYFSAPDPSAKRQSGFLIPSIGNQSNIGTFVSIPYYLVLDDQSDVTITPSLTTGQGENLDLAYRRTFNDGLLSVNGAVGQVSNALQGSIFATGRFSLDQNWRYGFDIDRASSVDYIRDYNLGTYFGGLPYVLASNIFAEGFGQGAYARIDSRFYQSLTTSIIDSQLPVVLPRLTYDYFGAVDDLGGRLSVTTGAFDVFRAIGTNTRRADLTATYERPFIGDLGELITVKAHAVAAAYNFDRLGLEPDFGTPAGSGDTARALPQAAVEFRWPFVRYSGAWGEQVIEPIVQGLVAPNTGTRQYFRVPNEDSFDLEFTDANLFDWNRFPGIDRLEGGSRVDAALHAAWYLGGTALDGQIGQSYQTEVLPQLPELLPKSGLNHNTSDIVGHVSFTPAPWFDVTYRTRLDKDTYQIRLADVVSTVGVPLFNVGAGYLRSSTNPYTLGTLPPTQFNPAIFLPRDEVTLNANTKFGNYRFGAYAQRNLSTNQMIAVGGSAIFENECYILDATYTRSYVTINYETGYSAFLIQMTFKTIGQFGFHAF